MTQKLPEANVFSEPEASPLAEDNIEGDSEQHVRDAITLLGLENNPTWAKGERILIQETYHLDGKNIQL